VNKNQSVLAHHTQVTTAHGAHYLADEHGSWYSRGDSILTRVESGPDTLKEIDVRRIARVMEWGAAGEVA